MEHSIVPRRFKGSRRNIAESGEEEEDWGDNGRHEGSDGESSAGGDEGGRVDEYGKDWWGEEDERDWNAVREDEHEVEEAGGRKELMGLIELLESMGTTDNEDDEKTQTE